MIRIKPETKENFSTAEVAKLMGISRIAVHKKIVGGKIKAEKIGRNYVITRSELEAALGKTITEEQKVEIKNAVRKAIREYGPTFDKLGKE